jgi:hypothetical protein
VHGEGVFRAHGPAERRLGEEFECRLDFRFRRAQGRELQRVAGSLGEVRTQPVEGERKSVDRRAGPREPEAQTGGREAAPAGFR